MPLTPQPPLPRRGEGEQDRGALAGERGRALPLFSSRFPPLSPGGRGGRGVRGWGPCHPATRGPAWQDSPAATIPFLSASCVTPRESPATSPRAPPVGAGGCG